MLPYTPVSTCLYLQANPIVCEPNLHQTGSPDELMLRRLLQASTDASSLKTFPSASMQHSDYKTCVKWQSFDLRPQIGENHLEEEHAHAVHVKLVWVVQAPQDGGKKGCNWQRRRPWSLHELTS